MKYEEGQVVRYKGMEHVVILAYGKTVLLSMIGVEKQFEVHEDEVKGVLRDAPRNVQKTD